MEIGVQAEKVERYFCIIFHNIFKTLGTIYTKQTIPVSAPTSAPICQACKWLA